MKKLMPLVITFLLVAVAGLSACLNESKGSQSIMVEFMVENEIYEIIEIVDHNHVAMPEVPVREGYFFGGWYFDNDTFKEPAMELDLMSLFLTGYEGATRVYVMWVKMPKFTIIFESYLGIEVPNLEVFEGQNIDLPEPSRKGLVFEGWYLDRGLTNLVSLNNFYYTNCTLYAKWDIAKYKITVASLQNGTISLSKTIAIAEEAISLEITPNAGCEFISGTLKVNGIALAPGETTFIMPYEDVEITAEFEALQLSQGLAFKISDNLEEYSVIGIGTCTDTEIVIPSTYQGKKVTSIGDSAFYECISITGITIPTSVTVIGEYAFAWCLKLTSVYITDIVAWSKISFADALANPLSGEKAIAYLNGKKITQIVIPNNETSIAAYAFCGLKDITSITIPSSVTSIGDGAFSYCTSLTSITIQNRLTSIPVGMFAFCSSLTSITIPSSVTSIGASAFQDCTSLTSITIPSSVTSIGSLVFEYCEKLTRVNFGGSTAKWNSMYSWTLPSGCMIACSDGNIVYK